MASRKIERRIDDALLATAMWSSVLYVRRRARRLFSQFAVSAAVGAGMAAAGAAGAVVAYTRKRARRHSAG